MTAPRIQISIDAVPGYGPPFVWWCSELCATSTGGMGEAWTIAAAADAGREHLRRHHYDKEAVMFAALDAWAAEMPEPDEPGYSRRCGVHTADCAASRCECAQDYPRPEIGAQEAAQRSEAAPYFGRCAACEASAHDNPMQATYEGSRADA